MNILVTGGAGYIGSHVVLCLLQEGHDVVVIDNLSNSRVESLKRVARIAERRPYLYNIDVRDAARLGVLFATHRIDLVMHFAGLKAVGESVEKPLLYYDNNVGGTNTLLAAMDKVGVKRMIFSSSATVYGDPQRLPIDETHPLSATNPYGRSKLMIEEILRDLTLSDPAWGVVALRYFNPVGAHESGEIGEDPNGIPNNLMPFVQQVAAGRREQLNIFGSDYPTKDGTGVRDYIHVMDLAEGHLAAIPFSARHGFHAINLGTGAGYSVLDMVNTFSEINRVNVPYRIVGRRPGDIAACYADASLAAKLLRWKAHRGLREMCEDAWRWQRQNPNGFGKS